MLRSALISSVFTLCLVGCKAELTPDELVAAKADQTLRQLLAGLNSKKLPVIQKLLVVTSTTGGEPRALTESEMGALVFPHPPYSYAGPGKPGYMHVRDGQGTRHAIHLIVVNDELRAVARRELLAAGSTVRVFSFLQPAPSK